MVMASTLPQHQVDYIVQLVALGNTKPEIIEKFDQRYHRRVHPTTIIRIKKKYKASIHDAHDTLAVRSELVGAHALKQKTYRLLDHRLDQAIEDQTEIDILRKKLQAGEIDKDEFDKEAARYERMTIHELTKVADSMHQHSKTSEDEQQMTPQDQAALKMLMSGINNGNPMQLIQVLNPSVNVSPTAKSPEPPADTQAYRQTAHPAS